MKELIAVPDDPCDKVIPADGSMLADEEIDEMADSMTEELFDVLPGFNERN